MRPIFHVAFPLDADSNPYVPCRSGRAWMRRQMKTRSLETAWSELSDPAWVTWALAVASAVQHFERPSPKPAVDAWRPNELAAFDATTRPFLPPTLSVVASAWAALDVDQKRDVCDVLRKRIAFPDLVATFRKVGWKFYGANL